jgi:hypothetical protein
VTISIAVEKYLQENSRGAGRPAINKQIEGDIIKDDIPSHNPSNSDVSKDNVVKLTNAVAVVESNLLHLDSWMPYHLRPRIASR